MLDGSNNSSGRGKSTPLAVSGTHKVKPTPTLGLKLKLSADARLRRRIVYMPIDSLNDAVWNPQARTAIGPKIRELAEHIAVHGILSPIHVLHDLEREYNMQIVDGHRRKTSGKIAGLSEVPVILHHKGTPEDIWADVNRFQRPVKAFDWMEAWYRSGGKVHKMSRGTWHDIQRCVSIFGKNGIPSLLAERVAPTIARTITGLDVVFSSRRVNGAKKTPMKPISQREIGEWMLKHRGSQGIVKRIIASKPPAAKIDELMNNVINDEPPKR